MRIPTGGFGNTVASPMRQTLVDTAGDEMLARAGKRLGETVFGIGQSMLRQAEQDAHERAREEDERASAKAGLGFQSYKLKSEEMFDGYKQSVDRGELSYTDAQQKFETYLRDLAYDDIGPASDDIKEKYQGSIELSKQEMLGKMRGFVVTQKQKEHKSDFYQLLDTTTQLAGTPGDNVQLREQQLRATEKIGKQAGLAPEAMNAAISKSVESAYTAHATRRILDAGENTAALESVRNDLRDGLYASKIDPERRLGLENSVAGRIDRIVQHQQSEQDRRVTVADNALSRYNDRIVKGIPHTPDEISHLTDLVKGTGLEGEFNQLLSDERDVQTLLKQSPEQMLQIAEQRQRDVMERGGDMTHANQLVDAAKERVRILQHEPLHFAEIATGRPVTPINPQTLMSPGGGEYLEAELQNRIATVSALRMKHGPSVQANILQPNEADAVREIISSAAPQEQSRLLGTIRNAANDDGAFRGIVTQAFKGDPTLLAAGLAAGSDLKTTQGRKISDLILEGRKVLADNSVKMPAESTGADSLFGSFNSQVGNAIPLGTPAREAAWQVTRAIYAKLARDDHEFDGTLNADRADTAIKLATGGVTEYNGEKTITPYGMDDDDFEDKIRASVSALERAYGYPTGSLRSLPVESVGNGLYYLRSGNNYAVDSNHRPLLIRIRSENN